MELFQQVKSDNEYKTIYSFTPPHNKLHLSHKLAYQQEIGPYTNTSKETYHENFFQELANQWILGQMVAFMEWKGQNCNSEKSGKSGIYLEMGFGTDYGICNFITPNFIPGEKDEDYSLQKVSMGYETLPKGPLNGENNGLSLLLDAETFDYGDGPGSGVGFKMAVIHPFDLGVIESVAINVDVGQLQLYIKV